MGIFSRIFGRKSSKKPAYRIGGMEDFMSLIRVYYQALMASKLGITNLAMLPDLRMFKMLKEMYGMSESFFTEIDASVKANCRNINQVNNYFLLFQGFSQDLLTVLSSTLQLRLRMPSFLKKALRSVVEKGVNDIFTKEKFKDDAVRKATYALRTYQQRLGYSREWMTEYAYHIILLAKKEPRNRDAEAK